MLKFLMNIVRSWRRILNSKSDDLEQYSRRQCLRIEEIVKPHKEKAKDVINLVKQCFAEADVDIPDTVIDRGHRNYPVYKDESDHNVQAIIVKFNNFRYRSTVYKNWERLKQGKRLRIYLTSNRYNLLKKAICPLLFFFFFFFSFFSWQLIFFHFWLKFFIFFHFSTIM